ncbi:hypothetical protein CNMCM5793_003557 [Aspergillus hiratsukae]|uniref:ribonuclease H n=1 Tax=Aspergillus hiratsukae TaxID=1194566 RepID=A0A8H6Q811_9EURO|nr:hypothetical protein CNMCM5793_003557 [Aspergillus hiratsukae]KAF7167509.1 hypothetical protein CNMCM6106_003041 [Aspergillus hiratsukae]
MITGMMRITPIGPLLREAALEPAEVILDQRQLGYAARLLGLPGDHPAKLIIPVSLREGDLHAQLGEQPTDDRSWAAPSNAQGPWTLGQHLARNLATVIGTDPSAGFEKVAEVYPSTFPGMITVSPLEEAIKAAERNRPGIALWSDGSRLEDGRIGAGIAWQTLEGNWHTKQIPLGQGKEVFDAELVGAVQALVLALQWRDRGPVTVLLDSQAAIARLEHTRPGPGQALAQQAHEVAQQLNQQGRTVTIQWVPGHKGIEGNEQADQAAKLAATRPVRGA